MNNDYNSIDRFSFERLGFLLKRDFVMRRRSLMLQLLLVIGGMCIFDILGALIPYQSSDSSMATSSVIFMIAMSIYTMVGASLTFSNLGTKAERSLALMQPATQLEHFLAKAAYGILLPPLFVFVGQFIGDAVRVIVSELAYGLSTTYAPFEIIRVLAGVEFGGYIIAIVTISALMTQTFYMLGSIVWPRLSFIKTFAALQIVGSVMGSVMMLIASVGTRGIGSLSIVQLFWACVAFIVLLLLAAIVTAYYRYREIEVVQRW